MSYDASMYIDTGGDRPAEVCFVGSETSNVAKMWNRALGHSLTDLDGRTGADIIGDLEAAIARMKEPELQKELAAMAPSNGFGKVNDAFNFLVKIRDAAAAHPKASLHLSY